MTSKKGKYSSKFQAGWTSEYMYISESKKGRHYAYCKWCAADFSVEYGGKNDITQHAKTKKHQSSKKAVETTTSITDLFPAGDDVTKVSQQRNMIS